MFRGYDSIPSSSPMLFRNTSDRFDPATSDSHRGHSSPRIVEGGGLNARGTGARNAIYDDEPPVYVIGFNSDTMDYKQQDIGAGRGQHQHVAGGTTSMTKADHDVGMALTSDDAVSGCPVHGHQATASPFVASAHVAQQRSVAQSPGLAAVPDMFGTSPKVQFMSPSDVPSHAKNIAEEEQDVHAHSSNRVFGLAKDLSTPSADSAHLLRASVGLPLSSMDASNDSGRAESSAAAQRRGITKKLSDLSLDSEGSPSLPPSTTGKPVKASDASADASSTNLPTQFSVEVVAPFFDKRGYPIFRGRGARIRGYIRLRPVEGCECVIHLGAHISQGTPAAIWDGVALMPPESGEDRKIFSTRDTIKLGDSMLKRKESAAANSTNPEDFIYETPFSVRLPLGISTRYNNGSPSSVTPVALPPSYEISSSENQREREADRSAMSMRSSSASIHTKSSRRTNFSSFSVSNAGHGISSSMQTAVEKSFGEVFRIGCFYHLKIVLQRSDVPPPATGPASRLKAAFGAKPKPAKPVVLDTITVPFIFLGEPTTESMPPHSIPRHLIAPAVARSPPTPLSRDWELETASAKWSGNLLSSMKRNVELELHIPSPPTLHTPCIFPVLLIVRPADPRLLAAVPHEMLSTPLSFDLRSQRSMDFASQSGTARRRGTTSHSDTAQDQEEMLESADDGSATPLRKEGREPEGKLSRFMRGKLSLSRRSNSDLGAYRDVNQSGSRRSEQRLGTASSSRPTTAPTTSAGSSSDGQSRASGTTLGPGGTYFGNLGGLVRISLVQTTFCVASGPSDLPKNLRKLIAIAEVDELDVDELFAMADGDDVLREIFSPGPDTDALKRDVQIQMRDKGVRVLRGTFRIGTDPTPSFRCHGVEVKYGIKVDLVPFSVKDYSKKLKHGTAGNDAKPSRSGASNAGTIASAWAMQSDAETGSQAASSTVRPSTMSATGSSMTGALIGKKPGSPNDGTSTVLGGSGGQGRGSQFGGASTIIAEKAGSSRRLEKGVGALFASARMVRGAQS